jgi:Conserved hypothetical protein 2217 (DUF2460)
VQAICLLALQMEALRRHREQRREEVLRWLTPEWIQELLFPRAAITVRGTATAAVSSTSITQALPSGTVVGDVTFIVVSCMTPGLTLTPPAGWTILTNFRSSLVMYRAFQTGDGSVAITASSSSFITSGAIAYTGMDTSTPVPTYNFCYASSANGDIQLSRAPDIYPQFNGSQLLCAYTRAGAGASFSTPSGLTSQLNYNNSGFGGSLGFFDLALSNGSPTGTYDSNNGTAADGMGISIELKAAGASAATPVVPVRPTFGGAVATARSANDGGSFAIDFTNGNPQNNDLIIVQLIRGAGTISPPTGYTAIDTAGTSAVFQHRWLTGNPTSVTFTSGSPSTLQTFVYLVRSPGAQLVTIDQHGVNTTTSSTTVATPVLTTTQNEEILLELYGDDDTSHIITWTAPSGPTDDYSYGGAGSNYQNLICWERAATAGATTARTATVSLSAPKLWAFAIALRCTTVFAVSGTFKANAFKPNSFADSGSFSSTMGPTAGRFTGDTARGSSGSFSSTMGVSPHGRFTGDVVVTFGPGKYALSGKFFTRGIFTGSVASLVLFPTLPGLTYPIIKSPVGDSLSQLTQSGGVTRVSGGYQARWRFTLTFEFLRSGEAYLEFQQLLGIFLQQLGQSGQFLYDDTQDDSVTQELFGLGDGVSTQFQLGRHFYNSSGGWITGSGPTWYEGSLAAFERIYAPKPGLSIRVNGSTVTNYTVGATGLVTFSTPPGDTFTLDWTGGFYYRCRFLSDTTDFQKLWGQMWSNKKLEFISVKV